jgi:hypothetical protein
MCLTSPAESTAADGCRVVRTRHETHRPVRQVKASQGRHRRFWQVEPLPNRLTGDVPDTKELRSGRVDEPSSTRLGENKMLDKN